MVSNKSLDDSINIIAALLHDVYDVHGAVFNSRALRLTLQQVRRRARAEGMGFLTKTLPRLGKTLDRALTGQIKLNSAAHRLDTMNNSELPRFLGEFFSLVFQPDGAILPHPCTASVRVLRQILYLFYKYKLPYTAVQEQQVIAKFEKTEQELTSKMPALCEAIHSAVDSITSQRRPTRASSFWTATQRSQSVVTREARILISRLFSRFDPRDIYPKHGPGAVSTKEKLHEKYLWSNISDKITTMYPADTYYYVSQTHVCDRLQEFISIGDKSLPAQVILVPKDSRGPRLISCEPVDYQWIQQGLGRAIVQLVENHSLTKWNVFFTDQGPNRRGALLGSADGRYSTLDLNEASDRVSLDLVRLLFPSHIYDYLEACRSTATTLPDGRILNLNKFAPMGSCLCFPILAITIWAILTAAATDTDTRESILVYGDDVIVPTAYAVDAMEHLESFGLKINHDKSCTSGLFRESCGMDAFQRADVTPVRLRTVWSWSRSPEVYTSWIAYANSFYDRQCFRVYDLIVNMLASVYGPISGEDLHLEVPSLREAPVSQRPIARRWNKNLQKFEYRVWDVESPSVHHVIDGWSMLLRYFAESANALNAQQPEDTNDRRTQLSYEGCDPLTVSTYTSRRTSMLVRRWR